MCNSKFNVLNEISVVFHNDSNSGYHFIIKELANEFEGKFESLGNNAEKNKIFSIPIEKKKLQISMEMVMKVLELYLMK